MKKLFITLLISALATSSIFGQKYVKLMNKGVVALQEGRLNDAIKYFNQSIAKKDNYYLSYFNRAVAHFDLQDTAKLKSDLDKALTLMPDNFDCLELYARFYYKYENFDSALQYANDAIEQDPAGYIALLISGEVYALRKNYKMAEMRIEKAYQLAEEPCRIAPYLGSIKTLLNNEFEASRLFEECKISEFYSEDYKVREALFHFHFNRVKKGKEILDKVDLKAVKNKSFVRVYYFYEANEAFESKDYSKGVILYNFAQQYEDENERVPELFLNRSLCYSGLGEYQNALADIDEYQKLSDSDTGFINRAVLLQNMKEYKKAVESLNVAIKKRPRDEKLYLFKLELFEQMGKVSGIKDSMESTISEALKLHPNSADLYYNKAKIFQNELSYKSYIQLIDSVLMYDPKHLEALRQKLLYYVSFGRPKSSNLLLERAKVNGLDSSQYFYLKASVLLHCQRVRLLNLHCLQVLLRLKHSFRCNYLHPDYSVTIGTEYLHY